MRLFGWFRKPVPPLAKGPIPTTSLNIPMPPRAWPPRPATPAAVRSPARTVAAPSAASDTSYDPMPLYIASGLFSSSSGCGSTGSSSGDTGASSDGGSCGGGGE